MGVSTEINPLLVAPDGGGIAPLASRTVARARTIGPDAVKLFRVSNTWDHEAFRERILTAAEQAGIVVDTVADLARATDIGRAMISKWFRGIEQPSLDSLRKISNKLHIPLPELLALTGRGNLDELAGTEPAAPAVDPLVAELNRMLSPDSALPGEERTKLRGMVELLVDANRRWMKSRRRPA